MTDLYAQLGLPRGASAAAIKRAYRQLARQHHPDSGGAAEEFAKIKRAYDVLIDPIARARYDATGLLGDEAADPARAQMLDILSFALDRALFALAQESGPNAFQAAARLPALACQVLQERRREWMALREGYQAALVQSQTMQGRLVLPGADSAIEELLLRRIDTCERQLALLAKQIEALDQALVLMQSSQMRQADLAAAQLRAPEALTPSAQSGQTDGTKPERFPYLDDGQSISFGRLNQTEQ
ncbi:MAG: J domain-containing protein [Alphaproteobacteria bacterium]|nr:J domain-containing protein [Alphaproteobacteria bacterium]